MNTQFVKFISDIVFIERKHYFEQADVVLYHPGHFPELNEEVIKLYQVEGFKKIMIPNIYNHFLKEDEYDYHKNLLVLSGIPEDIILPITGEAESVNEVIYNAMNLLKHSDEKNILLAGKKFFVNRFLLIASAFATENMIIDVLPLEDHRGINKDCWHLSEGGRKRVINEFHKISQFLEKNNLMFV